MGGSLPAGHPLSVAAARLSGSRGPRIPVTAPDPCDGWIAVDELADGGYVDRWLDEVGRGSTYGHRQAAAVKLVDGLAQALLGFTVQSVYLAGVAPDLSPDNVWLRWGNGRVNGVALTGPAAAMDVTGPAAVSGEVTASGVIALQDRDALDRWIAPRIAATFGPALTRIRALTRLGMRNLWGRVIDIVYAQTLRAAKDLGYDTHAAWDRAAVLADAIGAVVPRGQIRPRPFPVHGTDQAGQEWDGTWLVFGTCCFLYKASPDIAPCNVCPLRPDHGRSFDWLRDLPPAPKATTR